MIDAPNFINKTVSVNNAIVEAGLLPPAVIRCMSFQQGGTTRQIIIFEYTPPSTNNQGKGTAVVELADGRVFFFRTSLAVMTESSEMDILLDELSRLPDRIADWRGVSERVGHAIGAYLEFIDMNPGLIDSWNIHDWRRQAASRLANKQAQMSIQQIGNATMEATEQLKAVLESKLSSYMERLDEISCAMANEFPSMWLTAYNYFTSSNEQQRQYRRQFFKTFPIVLQQILTFPKEESGLSIRKAVDSGSPLVDHLAKLFGCSKASVRHLNGLESEYIGTRWLGRVRELLVILSHLDVNKLPKNKHEWKMFSETIDLLSTMTKTPVTSVSGLLLLGELSKLNWNRKVNPLVSYQERALVIENFAGKIRQSIIATGWLNGNDISALGGRSHRIATEEACSLGLSRLEKLAQKWRAEELRLDSELPNISKNGFPILLETPLAVGEMTVLQIKNNKQLLEEGDRMQNCVASYTNQCASGRSFIFSVRDRNGLSCVTVEYTLAGSIINSPEFLLIQQKGFQNSSPRRECYVALNELDLFLKSQNIRRKALTLLVYQKASMNGAGDMVNIYIRSLEFIKFLDKEIHGRFDFKKLVAETLKSDAVPK